MSERPVLQRRGIRRILELEAQVARLEQECSELRATLRQLPEEARDN